MKRKVDGSRSDGGPAAPQPYFRPPKGVLHLPSFLSGEEQSALLKEAIEVGCRVPGGELTGCTSRAICSWTIPGIHPKPEQSHQYYCLSLWFHLSVLILFGCALDVAGFFRSENERTKNMKMCHLGKRTEGPGSQIIEVPASWRAFALRAHADAKERDPTLPNFDPNVCVMNLYSTQSRLSAHVDVATRRDPLAPLVSLSIGTLEADFCFKKDWSKKTKEHTAVLRSGDAFVFGGPARGIVHSVPRLRQPERGSALGGTSRPDSLVESLGPQLALKLTAAVSEISQGGNISPLSWPLFRINFNFREK